MDQKTSPVIPALGYRWLTPWYDRLLGWTMPESAFKRRLLEQAQIGKGNRVLDLGCGTGTLTVLAKKMCPGAEVIGLDADPEILAIARRKVAGAGVEVSLAEGLATTLPYPDRAFDRVLSSLLFHHLTRADKARAMREVWRVLRPGGELHVADFGRPHTLLMRLQSLVARRFEEIADNVAGLLPPMLADAGFGQVEETARYATPFGTLSLYSARKSHEDLSR